MPSTPWGLRPFPALSVANPDELIFKVGVIVLLLGLVHAGITVNWRNVDGIRSIVIPARTALLLLLGVWMVGFGFTLH